MNKINDIIAYTQKSMIKKMNNYLQLTEIKGMVMEENEQMSKSMKT